MNATASEYMTAAASEYVYATANNYMLCPNQQIQVRPANNYRYNVCPSQRLQVHPNQQLQVNPSQQIQVCPSQQKTCYAPVKKYMLGPSQQNTYMYYASSNKYNKIHVMPVQQIQECCHSQESTSYAPANKYMLCSSQQIHVVPKLKKLHEYYSQWIGVCHANKVHHMPQPTNTCYATANNYMNAEAKGRYMYMYTQQINVTPQPTNTWMLQPKRVHVCHSQQSTGLQECLDEWHGHEAQR